MPDVTIVIDPEGRSTIRTIDLLEDFWFDYLLFRKDALIASQNRDELKTQRYLRTGIFSLLNYLTGLVNRWQVEASELSGASPETLSVSASLTDHLTAVSERYGEGPPPCDDLALLVSLASRCMNLQPTDESALFSALSFEMVENAEQNIVAWLDSFCRRTGLTRHTDTRSIGMSFADSLGTIDRETYHDFDALGDDPHPFQDDPEEWGESRKEQAPGQAEH